MQNAEAALRDARLAARESLPQLLVRVPVGAGPGRLAGTHGRRRPPRICACSNSATPSGGSTLLDVLTSQTQLDQARRDLIRARYDRRVAKAQLEALVGRDL